MTHISRPDTFYCEMGPAKGAYKKPLKGFLYPLEILVFIVLEESKFLNPKPQIDERGLIYEDD